MPCKVYKGENPYLQCLRQSPVRTVHEGVKFDCDQCGYAATDKIYLKLHVEDAQIAHEGILHNCEQCDFIGKTALAFVSHISAVHDNIRFCCDQCDYVASKNYTLLVYVQDVRQACNFQVQKLW